MHMKPITLAEDMVIDGPATEPPCPPTFNIQEEIVSLQVSFVLDDIDHTLTWLLASIPPWTYCRGQLSLAS